MVDIAGIRSIVGPDEPPDELCAMLLDWQAFWAKDHSEADWLAEPLIPAKRSVALFAPGGTGKSLLALWLASALATGRPIFGRANPPIDVLYLDYEMTEDDLHERLESMGYDADSDLSRLHYALLPSLPGLDQPEGGKAVTALARMCGADLVVVDTFGRAVHGDENEADTVRAWYRWTGLHLKAEGRAFVRVDHAGKDLEKGQRGSSAKNDDVDIVWQMTRQDGDAFTMKAKKRRMGWVPETVELQLHDDDALRYALLSGVSYPAGTSEVAKVLEQLGVPVMASTRAAMDALRAAGHKARNEVIRAAAKYRRESNSSCEFTPESGPNQSGPTSPSRAPGPPRGPLVPEPALPQVNGSGPTSGPTGAHPPSTTGAQGPSLRGARPSASPNPDPEELF